MRTVKVIIEKTKDMYSSFAENVEGIYGGGETVQEAKQSVVDAIRLLKKHNASQNIPRILRGEYRLVYKFDTQSLLHYYKGIFSNASLERITGINQRQLQHYATGLKKPRSIQTHKIQTALHKLGEELIAVEL